MHLKICTKIGTRYVFSSARIDEYHLPFILDYISTIQDINEYYALCRAESFEWDGNKIIPIGEKTRILLTWRPRVFTAFCTVVYMDRNINYKTYSPFSLFVNGNMEKSIPGYHSTEYEKDLKEALKVLA